ncbi:Iron sulfur protein [Roseibium aggregatum IAM 12614]|uniref:Iron sulfur protein n=2 Tax=Roseibium aggregatum TaxID=187304 RepID=A0NZM6_ROSAI|nr:Iron sulfur protein [Roseibium aggregatum IAM 12614]
MSPDPHFSASRRAFLKLPSQPDINRLRPPWTDEALVAARCTGCNACSKACPESILRPDDTVRPEVVFDGGECTFCGKCADACAQDVFDTERTPAWPMKAEFQPGCLQDHGIACQVCRDICPTSAIRIDLTKRPFGRLRIETDACTGCGACLPVCPQDALAIAQPEEDVETA